MSQPFGALRRPRNVCAILLLLLVASCSAWRPLPGVGLAPYGGERLGHARVLLHDGTELNLKDATIRPDSIIGLGGSASTRWAVARRDVARIDTRRTDNTLTFLAGVSATTLLLLLSLRG